MGGWGGWGAVSWPWTNQEASRCLRTGGPGLRPQTASWPKGLRQLAKSCGDATVFQSGREISDTFSAAARPSAAKVDWELIARGSARRKAAKLSRYGCNGPLSGRT